MGGEGRRGRAGQGRREEDGQGEGTGRRVKGHDLHRASKIVRPALYPNHLNIKWPLNVQLHFLKQELRYYL